MKSRITAYIVNDADGARLFLKHYHIDYREESEADGEIEIKVLAPRDVEQEGCMRCGITSGKCGHGCEYTMKDKKDKQE